MFEGYYSPPLYQDLYNFRDGAQNDIFVDSVVTTPLPPPSQSTPSHAPTIVDAKVAPVHNTTPSSSPTPPPPFHPQPNEVNPPPVHTSKPPQGDTCSNHHK